MRPSAIPPPPVIDEDALARYYRRTHVSSRTRIRSARLLFSFLSHKQQRRFAKKRYIIERGKLAKYFINQSGNLYRQPTTTQRWSYGCTTPYLDYDLPPEDMILTVLLALRTNEEAMNKGASPFVASTGQVVWHRDNIRTRSLLKDCSLLKDYV